MSKLDELLYDSLRPEEEPALELNRQIKEQFSKEEQTMKLWKYRKQAVCAAIVCVVAAGGVTAYASYRYLNPSQVADEVSENDTLSKAFEGTDAIVLNETQSSNGYDITLLGLVSGKNLDLFLPDDAKADIRESHTYAALAIAKSDGSEMEDRNFCISPLVNGVAFEKLNAASANLTLTWFEKDGVIYELIECDDLEIFADRGVWLGVVERFGDETEAFYMDADSGVHSKNQEYKGTAALFSLPLDVSKSDAQAAEQYLVSIQEEDTEDAEGDSAFPEIDEECYKFGDFVHALTADNIEQYFVRDEQTVITAMPDENGWIDFGQRYLEKYGDMVTNGGSGQIQQWIADWEDFNVTAYQNDVSGLQILVAVRNEDGSITLALYRAKMDLTPYIMK